MSDSNHDLSSDFPEYKDKIHSLKTSNNHFRVLFDKFHEINKKIMRAERREELISELDEEVLRNERLQIKDQLFQMLQK